MGRGGRRQEAESQGAVRLLPSGPGGREGSGAPQSPSPRSVFPREALGVVLHKDSRWYQQWKDFRDNNVVFNRECSHLQGSADSVAVTADTS